LRERDEVDVRAPARRACDERESLIAETERLQKIERRLDLDDWILTQRDADRVADALVQQNAHPGGGADRARQRRASLGDTEVQRIRNGLRQAAIRGDHHRHLESLHAHDDVVEVEVFKNADLREREVHHALCLIADVARLPVAVPPTQTRFDFRRGRGEARSSGRFRSTFRVLTLKVYEAPGKESVCRWGSKDGPLSPQTS